MHVCKYVYSYTYMQVSTRIYIYIYIYINTQQYTCIHTYIHTHIHTYIYTCIHIYIHTSIHINIHTYKLCNIFTYFKVSLPFFPDVSTAISNLLQTTNARWRHCCHFSLFRHLEVLRRLLIAVEISRGKKGKVK